ncbi:transposase [Oscillibacter sp.]|uniref:transposase n=1 Tax=Oscillibacter sp. TaxID=1945593 RepID=UPI0037CC6881
MPRNRKNLRFCEEHDIQRSGPALGRPKKDEIRNTTQDFLDECERVEVERRFSLAKRKCGLGLIMTKLRQTISHSVAMSILVLSLRKIQCALLRLLVNLNRR